MNAATSFILANTADGRVIVAARMDEPWSGLVRADIASGVLPELYTAGLAPTDAGGHVVLVDDIGREWPANLPAAP